LQRDSDVKSSNGSVIDLRPSDATTTTTVRSRTEATLNVDKDHGLGTITVTRSLRIHSMGDARKYLSESRGSSERQLPIRNTASDSLNSGFSGTVVLDEAERSHTSYHVKFSRIDSTVEDERTDRTDDEVGTRSKGSQADPSVRPLTRML
jgi:hypothetical protein